MGVVSNLQRVAANVLDNVAEAEQALLAAQQQGYGDHEKLNDVRSGTAARPATWPELAERADESGYRENITEDDAYGALMVPAATAKQPGTVRPLLERRLRPPLNPPPVFERVKRVLPIN